jgi:hypothetical protein
MNKAKHQDKPVTRNRVPALGRVGELKSSIIFRFWRWTTHKGNRCLKHDEYTVVKVDQMQAQVEGMWVSKREGEE